MAEAKKKNYREFTDDDLRKEREGLVKGLFNLRVRKVTDVVENPAAFKRHRREIARIQTMQNERAREARELVASIASGKGGAPALDAIKAIPRDRILPVIAGALASPRRRAGRPALIEAGNRVAGTTFDPKEADDAAVKKILGEWRKKK